MADDKKKSPKGDAPAKGEGKKAGAKSEAKGKDDAKRAVKAEIKAEAQASAAKASKAPSAAAARPVVPARLFKQYNERVLPELMKRFSYTNPMQAPRLTKIVVNMGVGDALTNAKLLDGAAQELGIITGQKPAIRRAKKSIANFKLRKGQAIGCVVTLRRARMWEFLDRLVSIAIPRIRDFRGIPSRSFDGRGNYTLGLTEQIIFPEINYDKVDKIRGMDVTFVTTAKSDEEGRELLRLLTLPFRQPQAEKGQAAGVAVGAGA